MSKFEAILKQQMLIKRKKETKDDASVSDIYINL